MSDLSEQRHLVVLPIILALGLAIAATFNHAGLLWIAAVVMLVTATIAAVASMQPTVRIKRSTAAVTGLFVVGAMVGVAALQAGGSVLATEVPQELVLRHAAAAIQNINHKAPQRMAVEQVATPAGEEQVMESLHVLADAQIVTGGRAAAFIEAAKSASYTTRSGLQQDFESATVTYAKRTYFITVPMLGTNLPEMTKVSYVYDGKETTTMEYAAHVVDGSRARLSVWQDGGQTKDVEIYESVQSLAEASAVEQVGFSWSKLNKCLRDAGLSQWIIITLTAACGLACAFTAGLGCVGCLAAATGFGAGTITGCVVIAST